MRTWCSGTGRWTSSWKWCIPSPTPWRRCWSPVNRAPAKPCWPTIFTSTRTARNSPLSRSAAGRCPRPCWRASFSVMCGALLPAPSGIRRANSRRPTGAPSFWTTSTRPPPIYRLNSCASSRKRSSNAWVGMSPSRRMCGSLRPPMLLCKTRSPSSTSGKTCTTASTWFLSPFRPCGTG